MQGDLSWIVGDTSAGAQAGRVGMDAAKIIEPEVWVVLAWIVLDEGQLSPAHGTVEPAFVRRGRECREGGCQQEWSSIHDENSYYIGAPVSTAQTTRSSAPRGGTGFYTR